MPDDKKKPTSSDEGAAGATPDEEALEPEATEDDQGGDSAIKPGMTEQEIRDAGLAIDVPFEGAAAKPQRLQYADLGPDKKYTPGR